MHLYFKKVVCCVFVFSFITAIELLGNPAEMYKYGTQYWTICFALLFVTPITTKFYLPVFMKLRLTSSFEVTTVWHPKESDPKITLKIEISVIRLRLQISLLHPPSRILKSHCEGERVQGGLSCHLSIHGTFWNRFKQNLYFGNFSCRIQVLLAWPVTLM